MLFIISDIFPLRHFTIEVGPYNKKFQECARPRLQRLATKHIDVNCRNGMKGRSVKITLLQRGFLALYQVAVYAQHG